jgi:hypothetical protein
LWGIRSWYVHLLFLPSSILPFVPPFHSILVSIFLPIFLFPFWLRAELMSDFHRKSCTRCTGRTHLDRVRRAVGSGGAVWFARRGREVERLRDDGGAGDGNGNFMCVFSKLLRV